MLFTLLHWRGAHHHQVHIAVGIATIFLPAIVLVWAHLDTGVSCPVDEAGSAAAGCPLPMTKPKAFIAPLNTTEKIAIVMASSFENANSSWNAYANTDGVSGLNFYYHVSGFVMGNALTQTWNRDLIAAQFSAIGDEYFATGYNVVDGALLGPLGRVPEGESVLLGCSCPF